MTAGSILFIVPDLFGTPGGIARYCRLLCGALGEIGMQVHVIALNDSGRLPNRERTAAAPGGYEACDGSRSTFIARIIRAALPAEPALVISGHPHFSSLGLLAARMSGAKLVSLVYGADVWQPLNLERRWSLRRADRVLSISRFTAKQVIAANGVDARKISILYNCLDPALDSRRPANLERRHPTLLSVARLGRRDQYKGIDRVISALPELRKQFADLTYDIVGDGEQRPSLEAMAAQLGVAHAIRFHGLIADERLLALYSSAFLYVMPSTKEGFGFVFIEAMAQGTPCIGGNQDATPEVILNAETGFVIDPSSGAELIAAITRLLSDSALRLQMGRNAIRHVEANFGYERFKQTLSNYLSELRVPPARVSVSRT